MDANLSPKLVGRLARTGLAVVHVADIGLLAADDALIFDRAVAQGYVVVTADTDFPMLLALRRAVSPSVVLLRHVSGLSQAALGDLLVANLPSVSDDLERGAVVSLSPTRLAVRTLPIR